MRSLRTASLLLLTACCERPAHDDPPPPSAISVSGNGSTQASPPLPSGAPRASASARPPASAVASQAASAPALSAPPLPSADGRPLHLETQEDLLALMPIRTYSEKEIKRKGDPLEFLKKNVGPGSPARMNQGNKEIASHVISREQCLQGLQGVVLQTDEQKQTCGADYMVPVYKKGDASKARFCIDIFEFPNRPCELPFVWAGPTQARIYCEMQGKRLCAQEEWVQACKGDPEGKEDWLYAYGNELDLSACNTNKPARTYGDPLCDPDTVSSTWKTCHSNTEPAGSFPRCRSRFGVFDLHGNVAEAMVRFDPEENGLVSQLKGSAFFYVDVARKHNERQKEGARETYPDHCAHDPRWHVEPMATAWHVNYHLGFRCCKTIKPR
ncbi:MAG: SUMF1/EgtB/PvdO family nonheme iron enzyme [Polyangiaceae bacterium]|nr:SUMF1/EgtB/PvdO family nonheme iron enzyme [Polyangiaceae bacterium]